MPHPTIKVDGALSAHNIWLMLKVACSRGGLTGHVRTQQCQYVFLACCTARQMLIRKHEQRNRQQSDPSQIPQGGCMWQWDFAVLVFVCSLSARFRAQAWLCTLCVLAVEPIAGGAHGMGSVPTWLRFDRVQKPDHGSVLPEALLLLVVSA